MKGFFKWFSSGAKMKRWTFLILIGIVLACYGISTIMVTKELNSLKTMIKIVVSFVVGFSSVIIGLVCMQKRLLELLVEDTDSRITKGNKNVNVKNLIFNKNIYEEGPNIVVIGGGTGLNTVLRGLKNYTRNITAIVTISDYGKLKTTSRKELNLLPLDDVKNSIIALADDEEAMAKLLDYNFTSSKLNKLNFGDIYFSTMNEVYGDFTNSVENSSKVLNMSGKILPVTLDEMQICAELEDGTIIEEKENIPLAVCDKVAKISRIFINPTNCRPAPGVEEAIKNADVIIIGPGSLYTNVIPNLLVKNVARYIKDSKATKVYISNIMTELGQTDNFSIMDHINAIYEHAGQELFDYCIYDTGEVIPEYIKIYNQKGADLVEQDVSKVRAKGIKVLQRNLSNISGDKVIHDPDAVAASIIDLICDDLRFKEQQYDPKFVMLSTKLKNKKKVTKTKNKVKKDKIKFAEKEQKIRDGKRRKSKFNSKYKDRIESIQTSDERRLENLRNLNDFDDDE